MFNFFKKNKSNFDIASINKDNINEYLSRGQLKTIYLISPDFGGSEGADNQVIVTPTAAAEKQKVDNELYSFLESGISVKKFNCNLDYKEKSIIPTKIIITAIVDGKDYSRIINVWS